MNYEDKKNKKDEVSSKSEDYLEETINTKTIPHHKSNKNKSKSINPTKNEIFHIRKKFFNRIKYFRVNLLNEQCFSKYYSLMKIFGKINTI